MPATNGHTHTFTYTVFFWKQTTLKPMHTYTNTTDTHVYACPHAEEHTHRYRHVKVSAHNDPGLHAQTAQRHTNTSPTQAYTYRHTQTHAHIYTIPTRIDIHTDANRHTDTDT